MDIDVSKENIQPLRGGRNLAQLGTALQAQSDHDAQRQLQLQKEEHEAAIQSYQGSDPLEPWFNYIHWVEQSYPKHGHEGHMDHIIKECLQLFEKDEKYYQDRRFVKLWIKYIDCLTNPLEIYQRLYNSGIGVECSEFYRAWSCYCEETGDYKKANQVYMLGIQAQAQPLDELEQAHMNFQLFFAQRMLHDDSPTKRKAASALAETRQALTSLKSFKRRNIANAPVQRIGETVRSVVPGVVRQGHDHRGHASNVMLNVYEDAPSTSGAHVPLAENPGPASLVQACGNVENEREIGIWTNAKTKMVHTNVVPHQPLPFTLYEDEDDVLKLPPNHFSYCMDDLCSVVALCVPDPPDASKIPCYNKTQVYVDNTEFSLEEIRSRKYELKKPTKVEEVAINNTMQHNNSQRESSQHCSALETLANCALDTVSEHEQLGHLMPLTIPTLQNIKVQNIHSPGEPKVLVNLDSKEFSELENPVRKNDENVCPQYGGIDKENIERPTTSNHPFGGDTAGPSNFAKNNYRDEFDKSLLNNFLGDSLTVNTKEARWELRNLFNDNEPSMVQPVVVQQFEMPNFDIHEDRSMTMALHTKRKQTLQDVAACLPPEDKENASKFPAAPPTAIQPNANKTAYYEEPSCTQVFNFNIKNASTPNMSQFKKPTSYIDQTNKTPNVPKFLIDESEIEPQSGKKEDISRSEVNQHPTIETQGTGLSVIMEATREYSSKSGSSSSGHQSTRTNFTGYTTTPFGEKTQGSNYNSMYHQQSDAATSKRNSMSAQSRYPNGQFARMYPQKQGEVKPSSPSPTTPYLSHDHQYQKPQGYNGYPQQRTVQAHGYQQGFGGTYPQGYGGNQMMGQQVSIQQGYSSPNPNYQSPQHPGIQSPHQVTSPVHPGFQSPPLHYPQQQKGYQSPAISNSPMQNYPNAMRQDYQHMQPEYVERQQTYANQAQQPSYQSPQQQQYANAQYYQRPNVPSSPTGYNMQQNYHGGQQYNNTGGSPYGQPNANAHNVQNFNQQSPYQQKHTAEDPARVGYPENYNAQFQIYQSPQGPQQGHNNYQNPALQSQPMQTSPDLKQRDQLGQIELANKDLYNANSNLSQQVKHPVPHKSPTSALRNIRHEQANTKFGQGSPDVGFSNQFLNFISSRNEPKDNANTPKFTSSPSISQKMHKNLYVSSPEQAQVPPSGHSDSESKDGLTAQTNTPIQAAKVSMSSDKNKDLSKRQLDFEHQSEDSRDSVSKESRISSVYSRQSDFHSDGYGMDVDSENSMECAAYKSMHSISLVETADIPRPADIDFKDLIDPFNKKLLKSLLEYVKFPNKTHSDGYNEVRSIPKMQVATAVHVGSNKFSIEKQLGKGNYGAVFLCLDVSSNRSVAVKYQKPSRPWEFYICQEVKARIKDPFMLPGYMDITTAYLGDNASLFVSEYSKYGSLLDVANKVKIATTKCINECIVFLLTAEMLSIVHYLHKAQIIHADIKPDNFLLMKVPAQEWRTPSLQLIDMGCAIDMSLFPEGTTFRELINTEGFTCTEMRERRPWTYQTDLYCLAGTIHVILLGSYMKVANKVGQWNIERKLPRYMKASIWDKIFTTLLNVPDCNNIPNLMDLKREVDTLVSRLDNLRSDLRNFANILKSR